MEPVMQPKTIYEGNIRITDVRAVPGDSAFLIDDGATAVLYDSGFAFTGRAVADNLRQVLGKRTVDYILLPHCGLAEGKKPSAFWSDRNNHHGKWLEPSPKCTLTEKRIRRSMNIWSAGTTKTMSAPSIPRMPSA